MQLSLDALEDLLLERHVEKVQDDTLILAQELTTGTVRDESCCVMNDTQAAESKSCYSEWLAYTYEAILKTVEYAICPAAPETQTRLTWSSPVAAAVAIDRVATCWLTLVESLLKVLESILLI